MDVNQDGENLNQPTGVAVAPTIEPTNQPAQQDADSDIEVSPPPPPPEPESGDLPGPQPIVQQPPNETSPEAGEQQPDQALEIEEEKVEREEKLTELIDEFANISEEDLKQYDVFREKTRGEKIKSALKGFGRRAAVYAAFGVGAYAFLHLAPIAIVAGAAAGLGGSTLSRGVVDMVKWASGAEKKEQAIKSQISGKQMEKLGNLVTLAAKAKQIAEMPGQQAMNPENNQIVTLEEAKFNFVKALVDFNDKTAAGNTETETLKKKYEKSRKGWGVAKTVASMVGGVVAGGVVAAEFKDVIVSKIAEHGFTMHGQGLGEIAPQAAQEHFVHLHQGEVVFNYNPGDLDLIRHAIETKPELAQIFSTTPHTKELISQGMHQAGEQLSQRFVESVKEVASARIAEFVIGAAATAEVADRVWKAISPGRSEEEREINQASKHGKENLEKYQGDLQSDINARANERFQAIFSGVAPENLPEVGQTVSVRNEINLRVPQLDGSEKQLIISPGDNLRINGVDQNGNISVTHIEQNELLTLTQEDFYRYVFAPEVEKAQEVAGEEETQAEENKTKKEETSPQTETPEEKELKELIAGNPHKVTIKKFENEKDNEFHAELRGKNRKLIFINTSNDIAPKAGENWQIEVIRGRRNNNDVLDVNAVCKVEETEEEKGKRVAEEELSKRFESAMQPGAVWKFDPVLVGKFGRQNEYGFPVTILSGKEEERFFKLQYYQSCKIDSEPYRNETENGKVYINLKSPNGVNLYAAEFDRFIKFMSPEFVIDQKDEALSGRFNKWAKDYVKENIEGEAGKPPTVEPPAQSQEPPPIEPAVPSELLVEPTPPSAQPVEQLPPQTPPQIGPLPQEPPEPLAVPTPEKLEEPPKPEGKADNGLKNGERLNPAELKDGDELYVANTVGSYLDEDNKIQNIPPTWLQRDFIFRGFENGNAELEDRQGNLISVPEGTFVTAFAKRETDLSTLEIVRTIASADEKPLDREKLFESYPIHLENGERIEIIPDQVWQWKTGTGENERSDDFVIENIKLVPRNGKLEIKFKGFDPVVRPTGEWSGIFEAGRKLKDSEVEIQKGEVG